MERWDAYNKDLEKIKGVTLIRGEELPNGLYHLVSDVIVKHTDGTFLLMQRDRRKPFGGLWGATAGGSALQGEDARQCAIRELREETGIESDALVELGRVVNEQYQAICVAFLCVTDCEKDSIIIQKGETSAYRWVTKEELHAMQGEVRATAYLQQLIDEDQAADITYVFGNGKFNYRVCAVIISDNKILAMRDAPSSYYYLPGGRVQMGETAEGAIIRELKEELNVTARIIRPLWLNQGFFTEDSNRLRYHEICIYFLVEVTDTSLLAQKHPFTRHEDQCCHMFEWLPVTSLKETYFYPVFLKTEIHHLPETFSIRTEFE